MKVTRLRMYFFLVLAPMRLSSIAWVSPVRSRIQGVVSTSAADISAKVDPPKTVAREVYSSWGGHWEVRKEDLVTAPVRVSRKVKLSVAVGLWKFILTIMFLLLRVGHTLRPLFGNFTTVDLNSFCEPSVLVSKGLLYSIEDQSSIDDTFQSYINPRTIRPIKSPQPQACNPSLEIY